MTDEDWHKAMLAKLDEWLKMPRREVRTAKSLFKHMYMSAEEFMHWRETKQVPKATRLCWLIFDDEIWEKVHGQDV